MSLSRLVTCFQQSDRQSASAKYCQGFTRAVITIIIKRFPKSPGRLLAPKNNVDICDDNEDAEDEAFLESMIKDLLIEATPMGARRFCSTAYRVNLSPELRGEPYSFRPLSLLKEDNISVLGFSLLHALLSGTTPVSRL